MEQVVKMLQGSLEDLECWNKNSDNKFVKACASSCWYK